MKCQMCRGAFAHDDVVVVDEHRGGLLHRRCESRRREKDIEDVWKGPEDPKWKQFAKAYETVHAQFYSRYGYYGR